MYRCLIRELAVVFDFVLEASHLLDNLLALCQLLGVGGLGNGTVDIVDSLSLYQS